jgi:hypothetical protein
MKEVKSSNRNHGRRTSKAMKARTYNHAKREALARTKRRKHDSGHKNWVYNVWTGPMPLLSELMSSRTSAPPLPDGQVLLEAGVLAYRRQKHGELQILLVSKKRSKKWDIPKGRAEPHMSFIEIAANEAFEEAGVISYISARNVQGTKAECKWAGSQDY